MPYVARVTFAYDGATVPLSIASAAPSKPRGEMDGVFVTASCDIRSSIDMRVMSSCASTRPRIASSEPSLSTRSVTARTSASAYPRHGNDARTKLPASELMGKLSAPSNAMELGDRPKLLTHVIAAPPLMYRTISR